MLRAWNVTSLPGQQETLSLMIEGRSLQKRLPKYAPSKRQDESLACSFSNLMFLRKTSAALDLLSQKGKYGVLSASDLVYPDDPTSPSVLEVLRSKHPPAQPVTADALLSDHRMPPQEHPDSFDRIDASWIRFAALDTKNTAGPSGLDAHCWRRLCTSFHSASWDLCHSLALFTRRLCSSYVDPKGLSAFFVCRLIALDKCPGVRPIDVCETAKKDDIQDASGSLQLCMGQIAGIEAAIHFMRESCLSESTEAVLHVDATNAFNSLNRNAAFHNIRHVCPSLATVLINTYRNASELFVDGSTFFLKKAPLNVTPWLWQCTPCLLSLSLTYWTSVLT